MATPAPAEALPSPAAQPIPAAPAPQRETAPADTVQSQLQSAIETAGFGFQRFVMAAIEQGWLPDSTDAQSFDEIPDDVATNCLKNWAATKAVLDGAE